MMHLYLLQNVSKVAAIPGKYHFVWLKSNSTIFSKVEFGSLQSSTLRQRTLCTNWSRKEKIQEIHIVSNKLK